MYTIPLREQAGSQEKGVLSKAAHELSVLHTCVEWKNYIIYNTYTFSKAFNTVPRDQLVCLSVVVVYDQV